MHVEWQVCKDADLNFKQSAAKLTVLFNCNKEENNRHFSKANRFQTRVRVIVFISF